MATDSRYRNWGCVVYPDSAPANWLQIAEEVKVPIFISPLHDSDIDPQDQPKKPHYHVMIMFEGKKSKQQVVDIFQSFGGVGCENINSLRGYARYLCHLDNPDKVQYDVNQVIALSGSDYFEIISLAYDKYFAIGEIQDFCVLNQIYSYAELCLYARANRYDWFRMLCDKCTVHIAQFLKSLCWSNGALNKVDFNGDLIDEVNSDD